MENNLSKCQSWLPLWWHHFRVAALGIRTLLSPKTFGMFHLLLLVLLAFCPCQCHLLFFRSNNAICLSSAKSLPHSLPAPQCVWPVA